MTWTFTITGPDGQQGEVSTNDENQLTEAATKLIHECLAQPKTKPSRAETQERKKARG